MDTKGWDIIYIASADKCNDSLQQNMSKLITGFDYEVGKVKLQGTFDTWKIVQGGSDKYVHFEMPIKSGSLDINGNKTDLAGVTPIMSIKLDFVSNPQDANTKNLIFSLKKDPPSSKDKDVFTVKVDARDKPTITPKSNPVAWGVMNSTLPELFQAHKEELSYVFAQINLVPPQDASWISPKEIDFAYLDAKGGHFVIFTCVENKDTSSLPRVPDTSILDTENDLFVCVSEKMVLQHLIQPGLPDGFGHGAKASNFEYKAKTDIAGQMEIGKIVNHGNLATKAAQWAADYYYPEINDLEITISNSDLHVYTGGYFDITGLAGASCSFSVTMNNAFSFDATTQEFAFKKDPNPSTSHEKHIPWYDWVLVAPFFAGLVALILALVTNAVTSSVTSSISGSQNTKLNGGLKKAVSWTGITSTSFDSVELQQAMTLKSKN
ncbi:MAG TPA: hypothetical protein DCR93_00295 [Cytophagales bacterium]|nr:hypothetical protein [Cytophagales bacterium]